MKQLLMAALLCLFLFIVSSAQLPKQYGSFGGIVVDSTTHEALSHVTVLLQEQGKDKPLKTTLTNEKGYFEFTSITHKAYILTFSYSGYKTNTFKLNYSTRPSIYLNKIALTSMVKQLKEVQVVKIRPVIEQDLDKIIYNVDSDPESKTVSAFEILRKVPLLSIDADDNIQINGNSNYRVLINGKPSTLFLRNQSEIFKNIPANVLKSIEVITVPSSRYEAQGVGGIINITTNKKTLQGYNGGINIRVHNPESIYTNGNITFNTGKLSFSANYGYNNTTNLPSKNTLYREDKLRNTTLRQVGRGNSNSYFQSLGGDLNYELNNFNMITATYNRNKNKSFNNFEQQARLLNAAGQLAEAYDNINSGNSKLTGNDFGLDYKHSFKRNDAQQLLLSYKWSNNSNNSSTDFSLVPLLNFNGRTSTTDNNDELNEHNVEVNYIHPIKKHTLELGIQSIFRKSNSNYFYKDKDTLNDRYLLDTNLTNSFNYKENIEASYVSFLLRMGKWGLRVGARLEQSKINAQFISSETFARQEYLNLIPNFTLSRNLKGINSIKMSYTQRIQRPDLYYLDPYVDKTDPLNISYGNPGLQPALEHVFELAFNNSIKKIFLNINLLHQFTNNSIQQFTMIGTDSVARTTFDNTGKYRSSNFSVSSNISISKLFNMNVNSSINYIQYTSTILGKPLKSGGLSYNVSSTLSFRYKVWRASSFMSYNTPAILVQGKTASYTSSSITFNRYILKNNKANIGFSVANPFREHRRSVNEINETTFYQTRESLSVIRRFNLSFNYMFTKVKASNTSKN